MSVLSKSFLERDPVKIALVGGMFVLLLLSLAFNFSRLPLVGDGPEYRAAFSDASGLKVGEDVRVAGIKVGSVTDIELAGDHVVVGFTVKDVSLGDETSASIEIRTLLGQHYVSLVPDGPGELEAGDEIPLARTSTPFNIVPAVTQLGETVGKIDTDQLARSFDVLANVLNDTAPEMRDTLKGLSALSQTIATRDLQIQQFFDEANSVSGVLAARDKEIGELLAGSDTVLDVLNRRSLTIRQVIAGTSRLARQLTGLVADNRTTLGPMLANLRKVVRVLERNDRQVGKLLSNMAVYAREFVNVGGTGRWFDSTLTLPRAFAVCSNAPNPSSDLAQVLEPVFSAANQTVNGSSSPCLPLGPATTNGGG